MCNENPSRRIISSGRNLLIEFEAGDNTRTSNGFNAMYRFLNEVTGIINSMKKYNFFSTFLFFLASVFDSGNIEIGSTTVAVPQSTRRSTYNSSSPPTPTQHYLPNQIDVLKGYGYYNGTMVKLQDVLLKQNEKDYRQVMANTQQHSLTTPATSKLVGNITNGQATTINIIELNGNASHASNVETNGSNITSTLSTISCRKGEFSFLICSVHIISYMIWCYVFEKQFNFNILYTNYLLRQLLSLIEAKYTI